MTSVVRVQASVHPGEAGTGTLYAFEAAEVLPFVVRRVFAVEGLTEGAARGGHANRLVNEAICCTLGAIRVRTHSGLAEAVHELRSPVDILIVPAMTWIDIESMSSSSAYHVLADRSHANATGHYVRDFAEFLAEARTLRGPSGTGGHG